MYKENIEEIAAKDIKNNVYTILKTITGYRESTR